jgi:hypothetical protein
MRVFLILALLIFCYGCIIQTSNSNAESVCCATDIIARQTDVGSDINFASFSNDKNGCLLSDDIVYTSALGNCKRSICEEHVFNLFRPYLLNTKTSTLTPFEVPEAEDKQPEDAQNFFSTFVDDNNNHYFYFSTDSLNASVYLNIKNSDGEWSWPKSIKVVDYGIGNGSVAVCGILQNSDKIFHNTHDNNNYSMIMYIVNQTGGWFFNWFTAGVLDVAFSNDGIVWSGPYTVNNPPTYDCDSGGICTEDCGVVFYNNTIYIVSIEGSLDKLSKDILSKKTLTYLYTSKPDNPSIASKYKDVRGNDMISSNGMYSPNVSVQTYQFTRYGRVFKDVYSNRYSFSAMKPSTNLFINLSTSYDADRGYMYISRAYPYPSDYTSEESIPCGDTTYCFKGLVTLPNRCQVYRMYIGDLSRNTNKLFYGYWELVGDYGCSYGYKSYH